MPRWFVGRPFIRRRSVWAERTRLISPADARVFAPGKHVPLLPEDACALGAPHVAVARASGDDGAALAPLAYDRYGVGGPACHECGHGVLAAWPAGRCAWLVVDALAPATGGFGFYSYAHAHPSSSGRARYEVKELPCGAKGLPLPAPKQWEQRLPATDQVVRKRVCVSWYRGVELFSCTQRRRPLYSCVENVAIPLLFSCMRSRLLMQHILQRDEPADQQNDERDAEPAEVFVDEGLDGLAKEIEEGG